MFIYKSSIGNILIEESNNFITKIGLISDSFNNTGSESKLEQETAKQLDEYFKGTRKEFNLPLYLNGTEFQKKVWQTLKQIPYGQTKSYKEIAIIIGNKNASRAVGMANNKNPFLIVIPCHRVIGSDGNLVGYALGLDTKQKLLNLEKFYLDTK